MTREQARAAGLTDSQITRRVSRGSWQPIRRGVFLIRRAGAPRHADQELDAALWAAVRASRRELIVSHAHAARLWGLPNPIAGWGPIHLLATSGSTRSRDGVRVHVAPCPAGDVVRLPSGLLLTSARRTAVDCLRTLLPPDALAIADAAARRWVAAADLAAAVGASAGWPGIRQARWLAALIDGRRENAFESWSALAFDQQEVSQPVWQVDLSDDRGFIGRVDGWWAGGLVGEADGRGKYALRAAERGGVDAAALTQVLHEERAREKRIRRTGADVIRWGPVDVLEHRRAGELGRFVRDRLAMPGEGRFTGSARPALVRLPALGRDQTRAS